MSYIRRPSIADRTMSSPQNLNTFSSASRAIKATSPPWRFIEFTPPASPLSSRHSRSSTDLSCGSDDGHGEFNDIIKLRSGFAQISVEPDVPVSSYTPDGTLSCPFEVDVLQDVNHRDQTFGYGAWSTVFKGTCRHTRVQNSGLMTPPLSPHSKRPLLVAVKRPSRKDAISIIESEARVLTHLMAVEDHESYIVDFFGILPSESSIVLAAIPRSLDGHIKHCAANSIAKRATSNMTQPVIGSERAWLDLAHKLISALSWLHNKAMVVHGDIKPGNILLSSPLVEEGASLFPFVPLLADFSSSQLQNQDPTPNTLSAITREYTAPELLSSKVLLDPNSTATTDCDIFSLAVTLLVAATGNTMVYSGSMFQRQAMAVQGWGVISNVQNSEDGLRIPRQGMVQRCLEKAVLKGGMGRVNAEAWRATVEIMAAEGPRKI